MVHASWFWFTVDGTRCSINDGWASNNKNNNHEEGWAKHPSFHMILSFIASHASTVDSALPEGLYSVPADLISAFAMSALIGEHKANTSHT